MDIYKTPFNEVIYFLLTENITSQFGITSLMLSIRYLNSDIYNFFHGKIYIHNFIHLIDTSLVNYVHQVNIRDVFGLTPLIRALFTIQPLLLINYLLNNNADINISDIYGYHIIDYIAKFSNDIKNSDEILKILLLMKRDNINIERSIQFAKDIKIRNILINSIYLTINQLQEMLSI